MKRIEMEHIGYVPHVPQPGPHPGTLPFVQIDAERCVGCDTCQEYCPTGAIFGEVGREHAIPHPEACINCGQCLTHCPELAIYEEQSWVPELEAKLARKDVRCIAMPAPAVRYALGDCFGLPVGSVGTGRMLSALKALGFAHCWDTEFAADVTIWEEASEFVERLADVHVLLPGLAEICRDLLSRPAAALFVLQVAHRHERGPGQDLRRGAYGL